MQNTYFSKMWKHVLFICLQMIRFCQGEIDPCDNATQLPFITQRVVNYTLGQGEQPVCDRYLKEAWYEMGSFLLANTTDGCGTTYNWYMNGGFLPGNEISDEVTVCRYENPIAQCLDEMSINTKKCGNNYIFLLKTLSLCDEAYCVRSPYATNEKEAPDISSIHPQIRADLIAVNAYQSELTFYCDFDTIPSTSYYYIVEWSQTTGFTTTQLIYRTSAFVYNENEKSNFLLKTALTESKLNQNGIDTLGFTIVCSVVASHELGGALSQTIFSPHKFCGIEVSNRTVTVKDGNDVTIGLRLTVPFYCQSSICQLRLEMYIPSVDYCSISEIANVDNGRVGCGVMFTNQDVHSSNMKSFKITSKFGTQLDNTNGVNAILFKTVGYRAHKMFGDYAPDIVRVHLVQDTTFLSGKLCYSHSDPHIKTFDGETYDNHMDGVFILYRNKRYKTEVQIKLDKCANYDTASSKPMCNCGVAIRAGRDVFVLNKCNLPRWDVSFRYCEDRLLKRSVKKHTNGKEFMIYLPSGTSVKVKINQFAEVDIFPSLLDKKTVDGLCGNFDSLQNTNFASDKTRIDFINSYSVTENNNLFDTTRTTYQHLESWGEEIYLCTCKNPFENAQKESLDASATCEANDKRTCTDKSFTDVDDVGQCSAQRRKRTDDMHPIYDKIDRHTHVKTDFRSIYPKQTERKRMFKRSVFSNQTAYENCISLMNTTAFRMCSNVPTLDLGSYIDNCVNDAMASGSMMWTQLHIEELKQTCVKTVEENQPIPAEVLDKIKDLTSSFNFSSNDDADNLTFTTSYPPVGTTTPSSPFDSTFTQSLLDDLKSVSCPFDCNGRGKCDKGVCICEEGYISDDCSISKNEPPIMKGIPDSGLCDLRQRNCLRTSVFGEKFVSSKDLSCKLVSLKMNISGHIELEEVSIQNASLHTFQEVACSLHIEREKRSLTTDIDNFRARGYQVSVSNDGITFSEADVIVIFDSKCVTCNKTDKMFICKTQPGFCQSNGMCYSEGETFGCYTCSGESTSGLRWTSGPECSKPVQQPDEGNNKLWLIGATVGPVVALVIILIIACYLLKKKNQYAGKVMDSVDQVKSL